MWLDENDYPVKPNETVVPIHLTLYFSEWRAKFRNVRCRTNWQKPNVTHHCRQRTAPHMHNPMLWHLPYPSRRKVTNFLGVRAVGVDETPRTGSRSSIPFLLLCSDEGRTAQECWIDTVRNDEFIEGYVCLDKNPVPSKMQPRPF